MYLNEKKKIEDGGGTTLNICIFSLNIAQRLFNIEYLRKDQLGSEAGILPMSTQLA